jgi:hypothetical protein
MNDELFHFSEVLISAMAGVGLLGPGAAARARERMHFANFLISLLYMRHFIQK